jgi:hypothetical protein
MYDLKSSLTKRARKDGTVVAGYVPLKEVLGGKYVNPQYYRMIEKDLKKHKNWKEALEIIIEKPEPIPLYLQNQEYFKNSKFIKRKRKRSTSKPRKRLRKATEDLEPITEAEAKKEPDAVFIPQRKRLHFIKKKPWMKTREKISDEELENIMNDLPDI